MVYVGKGNRKCSSKNVAKKSISGDIGGAEVVLSRKVLRRKFACRVK